MFFIFVFSRKKKKKNAKKILEQISTKAETDSGATTVKVDKRTKAERVFEEAQERRVRNIMFNI